MMSLITVEMNSIFFSIALVFSLLISNGFSGSPTHNISTSMTDLEDISSPLHPHSLRTPRSSPVLEIQACCSIAEDYHFLHVRDLTQLNQTDLMLIELEDSFRIDDERNGNLEAIARTQHMNQLSNGVSENQCIQLSHMYSLRTCCSRARQLIGIEPSNLPASR